MPPYPVRTLTGYAYKTRWDSNRKGGSYKPLTTYQFNKRRAIARGRILFLRKFRDMRYRRRVNAAFQQLNYRMRQLPRHLQTKILNM